MLCGNYVADNVTYGQTWCISEKYDGWRMMLKNGQFISRTGKPIQAPSHIVAACKDLPSDVILDGELWLGYERFQEIGTAIEMDSKDFKWIVFDMPSAEGGYFQRYLKMQEVLPKGNPDIYSVATVFACSPADVDRIYNEMIVKRLGVEGIVMRPMDMPYMWDTRNPLFMKRKPVNDTEARVKGYHLTDKVTAEMKEQGYVSSLVCELLDTGVEFKVTMKSTNPPPIGSIVTVAFQNLTLAGVPRFPIFKGVREDFDFRSQFKQAPKKTSTSTSDVVKTLPEGAVLADENTKLEPGQKVYMKAGGKQAYYCITMPKKGGNPYCSCYAWKYQRLPPAQRTCKHTLALVKN